MDIGAGLAPSGMRFACRLSLPVKDSWAMKCMDTIAEIRRA